jgi:hypothetical protein
MPVSTVGCIAEREQSEGQVSVDARYPDLLPADESVALTQPLNHYRAIARAGLDGLEWGEAASRLPSVVDRGGSRVCVTLRDFGRREEEPRRRVRP